MKLSIGEVSKIFNISREALRFYDKIGILSPKINKDNGYRYYEFKHLEQLSLILGIKLLGISLSDIKKTIESEDLCEYKNLVLKQEEVLQMKKNELLQLEYHLNKTKAILDIVTHFENEYNFDKLDIIVQDENLYPLDTKLILNSNISHPYNLESTDGIASLNKEIDKSCFYVYDILGNNSVIENEDVVFIKENDDNSSFIKEFCNNYDRKFLDKKFIGKSVSVNFYGTVAEINNYILLLNKHFNCANDNVAYVKYEFYLPKKKDNVCYFVNINLKIDN